jgi:hypothetical protein
MLRRFSRSIWMPLVGLLLSALALVYRAEVGASDWQYVLAGLIGLGLNGVVLLLLFRKLGQGQ